MIYIHKILPLFFSPVVITIALILVGLVFKRYLLIYLAVIFLFLSSTPIVATNLVKYLEANQTLLNSSEVKPADAIVVLGGMLTSVETTKGIEFEWVDPDRFLGGVDLALANKAYYLIFSGGKLPWEKSMTTEGVFLKNKASAYGISEDQILVTKLVENTEAEARAVKELLDEKFGLRPKSIILITSAFHMARAEELFKQNGFVVTAYPVDFKADISDLTPMSFIPSAYALKDVEFSLRELMGRFYYSVLRIFRKQF
jgi:uncharacterized SAM-binding protein YcdF (DUF218 family)